MVADFFTKPLQGSAFVRFRIFLLNVDSSVDATKNLRSVLGNIGTSHEEMHTYTNNENTMMCLNKEEDIGTDAHKGDVENPWFLVKGK